MFQKIDIQEVSSMLDVNIQTLRRWDSNKKLLARRDSERGHRYYFKDDIEKFLFKNYKYLLRLATKWSFSPSSVSIFLKFYCNDAYIFKARLSKLEKILQEDLILAENFSLVTSSVGEMGNNSFDHNIGRWPDTPGLFFGYNTKERKIILADRGQGVLTTLKRVKSSLINDEEALRTAFTEILSGRAPENRGNGLKYVKGIVQKTSMNLTFQSGKSIITIKNKNGISIKDAKKNIRGCFIVLSY